MQKHDILVVGASAGGIEALKQLVKALPENLPAAVFIVLHIPAQGISRLPQILNSSGVLKAVHPQDGEAFSNGRIYVAPPNQHLIVKNGYIRLTRGPKENSSRPAIDVLFRTAAKAYGSRVVGVVLSGTLDDGTAGLIAVKERGGVSIVQNPEEAMFDGMPRSAIENDHVDHILNMSEMAPILIELANQPIENGEVKAVSDDLAMEADMAELELEAMQDLTRPGKPSPFGCPDCGGVLWELDQVKSVRYRCRTGHAYSSNSLLASQSVDLEEALWNALRALEEKAALTLKMAQQAKDSNRLYSAKRFTQQGQDAQQKALLVRQLLLKGEDSEDFNGPRSEPGDLTQDALVDPIEPNFDFKVIALCASAGGLPALGAVLSGLEANFPAAITVVQHIAREYPSQLAGILGRRTNLKVKQAQSGDILQPGRVYIAPPDHHLLINPDRTLSLSKAALVNFLRPSADLLLESMAASFKHQAIAVILTGTGGDGSQGIKAVKKMGGFVIAQDQATSEFFGMPQAAINTGDVDQILPLEKIATFLVNLVNNVQQT